jgi:hypothetical protein
MPVIVLEVIYTFICVYLLIVDCFQVYDTSFVVGYRYRLSLGTGFHLDGHPVADPIQTQRIVNDYPNVSYTVILHYIYSL